MASITSSGTTSPLLRGGGHGWGSGTPLSVLQASRRGRCRRRPASPSASALVACVAAQPRGVARQAVQEHGLGLRVSHRRGRPLLTEQRRALQHVGKVSGVAACGGGWAWTAAARRQDSGPEQVVAGTASERSPFSPRLKSQARTLVQQRDQRGAPAAHGVGRGEGGEVGGGGDPGAVGLDVGATRPVAEPGGEWHRWTGRGGAGATQLVARLRAGSLRLRRMPAAAAPAPSLAAHPFEYLPSRSHRSSRMVASLQGGRATGLQRLVPGARAGSGPGSAVQRGAMAVCMPPHSSPPPVPDAQRGKGAGPHIYCILKRKVGVLTGAGRGGAAGARQAQRWKLLRHPQPRPRPACPARPKAHQLLLHIPRQAVRDVPRLQRRRALVLRQRRARALHQAARLALQPVQHAK